MSVTDDIKARLDIVSYINQYVPLKKAGKYHKAPCPFHAEKTPSFVVNDDHQSWRCFGACSDGGDIFSFAMRYHGWDFKEALNELGKLAGVEVQQRTPEQKQRAERADYLRGMLKEAAHAYYLKLFDTNDAGAVDALRYAREQRGLTDETLTTFGIGYAPPGWDNMLMHLTELGYAENDIITAGLALRSERSGKVYDRFRNRFMVPIRDRKGRVVGFGGRILDPDDTPKYMNSPQSEVFDKSHILFGLDLARNAIRESETAVVVEGYMDAITAHQAGFTNVIAQMGTALTETQLRLIAPKDAKRIVLALDSDAAGQNATRRSLEVAREALVSDYSGRLSVDMRVLQIPDAKDPDDFIRETPHLWEQHVAEALSIADFVIETELADLPPTPTVQQREAAARRVAPLLTATENNLLSRENIQKLALRLLLPERDLIDIAEQVKQQETKERQQRQARHERLNRADTHAAPAEPPPLTDYGAAPTDLDDDEGPPPLDYGQAPAKPKRPPQPPTAVVQWEAHLLNKLLKDPPVYYHINRKLHEAAKGDDTLLIQAMAPLGVADFHSDGLRAIMQLFLDGLNQDEMEPLDYVRDEAQGILDDMIAVVLQNRFEQKLTDETAVAPGDLNQVLEKMRRSSIMIDPQRDLIAGALRLRCRRLMRDREELRLVQANAVSQGDHDQVDHCVRQIDKLARAVDILEYEEKQVSRLY